MSLRLYVADKTKYVLTALVVPIERSRAARLGRTPHLRLHLGCARNRLPHWVNVDLLRPGRSLDLYWDLRRGLPFPSDSVEAIFAEHLFEHLTYAQGIELMRECRRVLLPDGILRIGVPDLGRYVASYLGQDDLIERVRPGRPTRAIALGEPFFGYGHQCMYDFETLDTACRTAGFAALERSAFGEGRILPNPDTRSRRDETLYVDALK
jgi:SAM-dependent methyltransferase